MANTFRLKRSAVDGKAPTTTDLQLGELAVNTYNGRLYTKKNDGTDSIVLVGPITVSATDKVLGRVSAGAGAVEEITCTAAGRALIDDANAAAQRTTLGLGTLATQSGTFSGTSSGTNTGDQNVFANIAVTGYINMAATSPNDTLTVVPGSGIAVASDYMMKTLTISSTGGVSDGDKGDISVSGSGSTWIIDNQAVTYAKIQNVTNNRLLGRADIIGGPVQEITVGNNLSLNGTTLNATTFQKVITSGTAAPSGGVDGDIYIQYT